MPETLIVLPTLASMQPLYWRCLTSLRLTSQVPFRLYLVFDGATDDTVSWFFRDMPELVGIDASAVTRGLVHAYNAGAEYFLAHPEYDRLCLIEDCIQFTWGWDTALHKVLTAHPEFGWVSCLQLENQRATFFAHCSLMSRACLESFVPLKDPRYSPAHFDDADSIMRARDAGWNPMPIPHRVSHDRSRTSVQGVDETALFEEKRRLFAERWKLADFDWISMPKPHGCERCTPLPAPECSFCGAQVPPMIIKSAVQDASICNVCLEQCIALLNQGKVQPVQGSA